MSADPQKRCFLRRVWLAVQIGHRLFALWPFDWRVAAYHQPHGLLTLAAGMSDRPKEVAR
jgi:hypothetical protein